RDGEVVHALGVAAVKDAKNEVLQLEAQAATGAAGTGAAGGGANDAEFARIQKEREAAAIALAGAKAQASQEADERRKALDDAIEAFQQQAAGMARENPELAQYVSAVQQLQE